MATPQDALQLAHIGDSALPAAEKSFVMRMAMKMGMTPGAAKIAKAKSVAISSVQAVRTGAEAVFVGGLLGLGSTFLPTGLDLEINSTTNGVRTLKASVPVDFVLGLASLGASVALDGQEGSTDARNTGGAAIAVFGYRKAQDWSAEKMLADNAKKTPAEQKTPGFTVHKADTNIARLQAAQNAATKSGLAAHGDFGEDPIVRAARGMRAA